MGHTDATESDMVSRDSRGEPAAKATVTVLHYLWRRSKGLHVGEFDKQ